MTGERGGDTRDELEAPRQDVTSPEKKRACCRGREAARMPPSKRAKGAAAANDVPTNAQLIARCSRADLEQLIGCMLNEQKIGRSDLLALLPHERRGTASAALECDGHWMNTGPFELLSVDLLMDIFQHVPFEERLTCATEVCKSWRGLQAFDHLWRTIRASTFSIGVKVDDTGFVRLLNHIGPSRVHKMELWDVGDRLATDTWKKAIKLCPQLRELVIHGDKKVTASTLHDISKQPYLTSLKRLDVQLGVHSGGIRDAAKVTALRSCIAAAHSLEEVFLPDELFSLSNLQSLAAQWRTARGGMGAKPLLTTLRAKFERTAPRHPDLLVALNGLFPELRHLSLCGFFFGTFSAPVEPMLNLRELSIGNLFSQANLIRYSSAEFQSVLRAVVVACPSLEALDANAPMDLHLWQDMKNHPDCSIVQARFSQSAPVIGDVLHGLPPSLKRLDLSGMQLSATSLIPSKLPNLKYASFPGCGHGARPLAEALVAEYPKMTCLTTLW